MSDFQSLLDDAVQLPVAERMRLIEALWESFPTEAGPTLSEAWMAEIRRRSDEFERSEVKTIPWEQIREQAAARVGLNASG